MKSINVLLYYATDFLNFQNVFFVSILLFIEKITNFKRFHAFPPIPSNYDAEQSICVKSPTTLFVTLKTTILILIMHRI